ncbi:Tripartite DNA replication factor [Chytridiales sp. JEL 0842]|nr:Tripartite DNA replication factor [Chytridiales sp. JEL 0842]
MTAKGKVVLAYSGGLDTSCILAWLIDEGYDVVAYMANIGQEEDFEAAKAKALKIGASKVYIEDLRKEFVEGVVFDAVKANALYEGVYLLGTSLARPVITKTQIDIAHKEGAQYVSHGCTGKGNDQVRFELGYLALEPTIKIIAPWRIPAFFERFPGRSALLEYAAQKGIPVVQTAAKPWSTDENLYHISYEAGILEDPDVTPPKDMWKLITDPEDAPNVPERIAIHFKEGKPVRVDNVTDKVTSKTDPLELFLYLNALGRKHGIGRIDIVENRFIGIKSRGCYETPGGTILRAAHVDLEGLTLDKEVRRIRDQFSQRLAEVIYNGMWFSPERELIMAAVDQSQAGVTGIVRLKLYKGNVIVEGRTSPYSLYDDKIASMDIAGGFNPSDSEGFIRINAIRLKAYVAQRKQTSSDSNKPTSAQQPTKPRTLQDIAQNNQNGFKVPASKFPSSGNGGGSVPMKRSTSVGVVSNQGSNVGGSAGRSSPGTSSTMFGSSKMSGALQAKDQGKGAANENAVRRNSLGGDLRTNGKVGAPKATGSKGTSLQSPSSASKPKGGFSKPFQRPQNLNSSLLPPELKSSKPPTPLQPGRDLVTPTLPQVIPTPPVSTGLTVPTHSKDQSLSPDAGHMGTWMASQSTPLKDHKEEERVFWHTSPPYEKLMALAASEKDKVNGKGAEEEISDIVNILGGEGDAGNPGGSKLSYSDSLLSSLWTRTSDGSKSSTDGQAGSPANLVSALTGVTTTNFPRSNSPSSFLSTPLHSKGLKRSLSLGNLSSGNRPATSSSSSKRSKREHWSASTSGSSPTGRKAMLDIIAEVKTALGKSGSDTMQCSENSQTLKERSKSNSTKKERPASSSALFDYVSDDLVLSPVSANFLQDRSESPFEPGMFLKSPSAKKAANSAALIGPSKAKESAQVPDPKLVKPKPVKAQSKVLRDTNEKENWDPLLMTLHSEFYDESKKKCKAANNNNNNSSNPPVQKLAASASSFKPLAKTASTAAAPSISDKKTVRDGDVKGKGKAVDKPPIIESKADLHEFSEFEDEFDAMESEELERILQQAEGLVSIPSTQMEKSLAPKFHRMMVLQVQMSQFHGSTEQILRLFDEKSNTELNAYLRDTWSGTEVSVGDYVHIIGSVDLKSKSCIIDNAQNFLIVHPDILISATSVADSFQCLRKSILQERVKVTNDISAPMVYGNLLHSLLQKCLQNSNFTTEFIMGEIEELVSLSIEDLYAIGESETTARTHLQGHVDTLKQWSETFVSPIPKLNATVDVHRGDKNNGYKMAVTKVLDIEEHIWSPMYGLKGNIDVTVEIKVHDHKNSLTTLAAPFEIKTGRSTTSTAHRGQATLYTLMMSDRYGVDISASILYYLAVNEMLHIPVRRDEITGLIAQRNTMANYLHSKTQLPPMTTNTHSCKNCYALDTCLVYHKSTEGGTYQTSQLGSLFNKIVGHMTETHAAFFDKWEKLITKEEGDIHRTRKEIWTLTSDERHAAGRCFRNMVLTSVNGENIGGSKVQRFMYTFSPWKPDNQSQDICTQDTNSLLNSTISVGDAIVVSSEKGHYALSIGFVTAVTPGSVHVNVDRALHGIPERMDGFNDTSNQCFKPFNAYSPGGLDGPQTMYRIDKDEVGTSMAMLRGNLVNLFKAGGDVKRRRLVVDLEPPAFRPLRPEETNGIDSSLNIDQKKALERVLSAQDYALILGMPGTGKTTTIAQIIKMLVSQGKSVLLTSYTHSAVDNVLLKLKKEKIGFLRLGSQQKVHPAIKEYTAERICEQKTTVNELSDFYESQQVVATTCLGIKHVIFSKRVFDYCIVDEASQLTLPTCLGPLKHAHAFVLVGDPYQLPPLVRDPEARDGGLNVSLFRLLLEAHPEAVVTLEHQYRMNAEIMLLSNTLVYGHRLRCGTEGVAASRLELPSPQGLASLHNHGPNIASHCSGQKCWIADVIAPERSVLFLDTDEVPGSDARVGDLVHNQTEADLVFQITEALIRSGVEEREIGIISPYRSQLKTISYRLRNRTGLEMLTVDKYQGRDKACIVVSLVRSNPKQNIGDLLRDWRRINVALTRAQTKLIILGSKSTLQGSHLYQNLLNLVEEKGWLYRLPKDATKLHHIEEYIVEGIGATQPGKAKQELSRVTAKVGKSNLAKDILNDLL